VQTFMVEASSLRRAREFEAAVNGLERKLLARFPRRFIGWLHLTGNFTAVDLVAATTKG